MINNRADDLTMVITAKGEEGSVVDESVEQSELGKISYGFGGETS